MSQFPKKNKGINRRKLFPLLGSSLLLPFLGFNQKPKIRQEEENETYETLLKSDGTTVRVRKSSLKNARVVQKNISNTSLLNWLGKKKII